MLKKLIKFIEDNYPNSNSNEWLDSKYIHLNDTQLKKIADAYHDGNIVEKTASNCPATQLIFHFGNTLVLIKKSTKKGQSYLAELAWEADFQSTHSVRQKDKGFHFINFALDNHYQLTLLPSDKKLVDTFVDEKLAEKIAHKSLPIIKVFMCAISQ